MCSEIIVRYARDEDLQQRMELVRNGLSMYFWDAFIYFFFQELILECCVLSGAVLFIFLGVSLPACLLLAPAAAALVALAVACTHHALAHKQAQSIRKEMFGLVAEVKGRLLLAPGKDPISISIQLNQNNDSSFSQVMGTVSVSEYWGPENNGWLHAMVVHPQWRRRGVARALAGAARRAGWGRWARRPARCRAPRAPRCWRRAGAAGAPPSARCWAPRWRCRCCACPSTCRSPDFTHLIMIKHR